MTAYQPPPHRFEDKPALFALLSSFPPPAHITKEDYETILFVAERFGPVALTANWWEDQPTPDLLLEVPAMPEEHYKEAVSRYIELLFARTHPQDGVHKSDEVLRTEMWDVICYLRRRLRCGDAIERLRALAPVDPHPKAYSGVEYQAFVKDTFPQAQKALIEAFSVALSLPFSHEGCQADRAHVTGLLEDEALLTAQLCDITPPWRAFPDLARDAQGWEHGAGAKCLARFGRYYHTLTVSQRLRLRKYIREPRAFSGIYAAYELEEIDLDEETRAQLCDLLRQDHHLSPSACKRLAERFRAMTGEPDRGVVIYRGGVICRAWSDVEDGAVRESAKHLIAFRRGNAALTITEGKESFFVTQEGIALFIEKKELPCLDFMSKEALVLYATERILKDAFDMHSVLYSTPTSFVNLEQKRAIARQNRDRGQGVGDEKTEGSPSSSKTQTNTEQPVLTVGQSVQHRVWGQGRLLERQIRSADAFWRVSFDVGEKTMSEEWLIANCITTQRS